MKLKVLLEYKVENVSPHFIDLPNSEKYEQESLWM